MSEFYNEFDPQAGTPHPFRQHLLNNKSKITVDDAQALLLAEQSKGSTLTPIEAEVVREEGFSSGWYPDSTGVPTTGIGQTGKWANLPFSATVTEHENRVKRLVPGYESLPEYLRADLTDSAFRGGITGSPTAVKHINAGDWDKAAVEFIDHDNYRTSMAGNGAIAARMDRTAASMVKYGNSLKPTTTDYTVKSGDNLTQIAAAHGLTVDQLVNINSIQDRNRIKVGQVLQTTQTVPPQQSQAKPTDTFLDALFSSNSKKEVAEQIPKTAKSFWATLFGDS